MSDDEEMDLGTSKGNKRVYQSSENSEGEDSEASFSDNDENFRIPDALKGRISRKESMELSKFKKHHTEMEFEAEVMRIVDTLQSRKDLELLKKMQSGGKKEVPVSSKRVSKVKPSKAKERTPRAAKRAKVVPDGDDDEEEEEDFDAEEEESAVDEAEDESSDDDDLFDDDELEEIDRSTKRIESDAPPAPRTGRLAKSLGRGKSALEAYENEQDLDDVSDEDVSDSDDDRRSRDKKKKTRAVAKKGKTAASKSGPTKKTVQKSRLIEKEEEMSEADELPESEDESAAATRAKKKSYREDLEENVEASPDAELEDYQRLQSRRMYLEKWINEPYFEDVVKGSYVRFHVGQVAGQAVYRMALVQEIQESKRAYKMPGTDVLVDKQLVLAIADSVKVGRLDKVSNSRITEAELKQYVAKMKESGMDNKLLTKKQANKRREWVNQRLHHTYTHEEIAAIIARNDSKNKALTTTYSETLRKLEQRLQDARQREDFDTMESLQKDIEKLQRDVRVNKELYSKNYGVFVDINKRNKKLNLEVDMAAGVRRKKQELTSLNSLAKNLEDPFARRDTRPKVLWVTGAKKPSDSATGGAEESKQEESSAVATASEQAEVAKKQAVASKQNSSFSSNTSNADVNPEELGRRLEEKFGFANPWTTHTMSKAERYLGKACANLPPRDSAERELMRRGKTLASYLDGAMDQGY